MDRSSQAMEYRITDDILNTVSQIVERLQSLKGECIVQRDKPAEELLPEEASLTYRQRGTGVFAGEHLLCRAPMPQYVEGLMEELDEWLEKSAAHLLIKAGMVLYRYIMIQPYDENDNACYGMRRAENVMQEWKPQLQLIRLADCLSEEGLIKALEQSDLHGEAGPFLAYFLKSVNGALDALTVAQPDEDVQENDRVSRLLECMGSDSYTTKELMGLVGLKHRPTFRDNYLLPAMEQGLVEMTVPDKPNSSQQRYRRVQEIKEAHPTGQENSRDI